MGLVLIVCDLGRLWVRVVVIVGWVWFGRVVVLYGRVFSFCPGLCVAAWVVGFYIYHIALVFEYGSAFVSV